MLKADHNTTTRQDKNTVNSGGGAQQHPPPARLADGEGGAVRGTGRRRPLRAGARPGLRSQSRPRPSTAGRPRCPAIWKGCAGRTTATRAHARGQGWTLAEATLGEPR